MNFNLEKKVEHAYYFYDIIQRIFNRNVDIVVVSTKLIWI